MVKVDNINKSKSIYLIFCILLSIIYIFSLFYNSHNLADFTSLYTAETYLQQGLNPYQNLYAEYFKNTKVAANLNPPFTLLLYSPILKFDYTNAATFNIWLNFILAIIGSFCAYKVIFSNMQKQHLLFFLLINLGLFANIINLILNQIGAIIMFFIIIGYFFYKKQNDFLASFCWGFAAAMKLFPALLWLFALKEKRYKVFVLMFLIFSSLSLIPLLIYDKNLFQNYFKIIQQVSWYGDNWNGSIYGFIFRLTIYSFSKSSMLPYVRLIYLIFFAIVIISYMRLIKDPKKSKQDLIFSLTLILMLLLSPFGWIYYFPILTFPLFVFMKHFLYQNHLKNKIIWLITFFIINFPLKYGSAMQQPGFLALVSLYSLYFYGLLLTGYLFYQAWQIIIPTNAEISFLPDLKHIIIISLSFNLLFISLFCLAHF